MNLTNDFRKKVAAALLDIRPNFSGSDEAFAKQWKINKSVFSRIKSGEVDNLLKDSHWLSIGRQLEVRMDARVWKPARTKVFTKIEQEVDFCQQNSKSKVFVDDSDIGKTFAAKYLARTRSNCFYVDASQAKTPTLFARELAKAIGVDSNGQLHEVKANIKYYLAQLPKPMIIVDEAGDLRREAFQDLKEYWNATENVCGWYLLGAEGLREFIKTGIKHKTVGFTEIFSRFSSRYSSVVPVGRQVRQDFYRELITDVLNANAPAGTDINAIVAKCLVMDKEEGRIGGLRRAESLLILHSA